MNRKAFVIISIGVLILFGAAGIAPPPARAQFPMFFGATRFPALGIDSGDNIYLAMSVATAPASEHRPHSQIFFTQSRDGGKTFDNLPQTRNLSNSPGEAFGPSIAIANQGKFEIYITYHDNSS